MTVTVSWAVHQIMVQISDIIAENTHICSRSSTDDVVRINFRFCFLVISRGRVAHVYQILVQISSFKTDVLTFYDI